MLQQCDCRIAMYKTLKEVPSTQLVQMTADEVTLSVCNSKGWDIAFDRDPTKVI